MIVLNDLYMQDTLVAFEVLENHRLIMARDASHYVNFKTAVQPADLDHQPLLEQNRENLIHRIASKQTIGERHYVRED